MNTGCNVVINQAVQPMTDCQSASTDGFISEWARSKRVADATVFRSKYARDEHPTLKLDREDLARVWGKFVLKAADAMAHSDTQLALTLWQHAADRATNSRQLAYSLSQVAGIYFQQGRYSEAEPAAVRAAAAYENESTECRLDLAKALNNLALLYHAMGRLQEAANYYKRCLDIRLDLLAINEPVMQSLLTSYKTCLNDIKVAGTAFGANNNSACVFVPAELQRAS